MDESVVQGVDPVASPPTTDLPDFSAFKRAEDARMLGREPIADDTPAASSPAPEPEAVTTPTPKGKTLQSRKADVDREVSELKEQIRLRNLLRSELAQIAPAKPDAKPDSSPAPAKQADWQRYLQHPDAPQLDQFETYEQYHAALGVFVADQRLEERTKAYEADRRHQSRLSEVDRVATTARQRLDAARTADPEFDDKLNPQLLELRPAFLVPPGERVQPHEALIAEVIQSEQEAALLLHFSTPEGQKEWTALCQVGRTSPTEMLRRLGRLEARLESPAVPETVTHTKAPPPPTILGKRPAEPADPMKSAVAAGDFRAFKRAEDARMIAARR